MSVVVKRSLAFKDLAEIWSFIADDSEANADQFLATLDDKLKVLATQPRMGRLRDELIPELNGTTLSAGGCPRPLDGFASPFVKGD